jgi:predicted HD phosphohydrolase
MLAMESLPDRTQASFASMDASTADDWLIIARHYRNFARELPDRVLAHLKLLEGDCGGFSVDRLKHSLQTATLAFRAGESEEYVVCALMPDVGDTLGAYNHADVAAAILAPFVSEENRWMVAHHAIFQGYYFFHHLGMDRNMREAFRDHACFERTARFCERYDNLAFDVSMDSMPLAAFEPMVCRVFEKPKQTIYKALD